VSGDTRRTLLARLGAESLHAQRDRREITAAARLKFLARFVDEVDPLGELEEPERLIRAEHALRAHMLRLALESANVRAKRAQRRAGGQS
jgi:hypothetical protein